MHRQRLELSDTISALIVNASAKVRPEVPFWDTSDAAGASQKNLSANPAVHRTHKTTCCLFHLGLFCFATLELPHTNPLGLFQTEHSMLWECVSMSCSRLQSHAPKGSTNWETGTQRHSMHSGSAQMCKYISQCLKWNQGMTSTVTYSFCRLAAVCGVSHGLVTLACMSTLVSAIAIC